MILGIDASNIRAGGGVTHLVEILAVADPQAYGFKKVIVWAGSATLARIGQKDWLRKIHHPYLDKSLLYRTFWQLFIVGKVARQAQCDILFVPGGFSLSNFRPVATMVQNQLLYDFKEIARYGFSLIAIRLHILRYLQIRTLRKSSCIIFLTNYTMNMVYKYFRKTDALSGVIPHGINRMFFGSRPSDSFNRIKFNEDRPCRVLYVSTIDLYKHQWNVVDAVAQLRSMKVPVQLHLVGSPGPGSARLEASIRRLGSAASTIFYHGEMSYKDLSSLYCSSDIIVFASTCEAFSLILLEAMASGVPIACSDSMPMTGILNNGGIYFNAESPDEIALAISSYINSSALREEKACIAYNAATKFNWRECSGETFRILAKASRAFYKAKRN